MRIVVAPSGYKECLDAEEVARAIAEGIRRASPEADIIELPLVDGGEGFTRTLVGATGGRIEERRVTGPVGEPVDSHLGWLGGAKQPTAVIEMAAAAGLRLVPRDRRDPLRTTTRGVGELIRSALDGGARRILLGCGDSGTNDGGAGMAQALGVRLLDRAGGEIGHGGAALLDLDRIDLSGRDPRLAGVQIDVACNIHNLLCGPRGVARVFGPQKGASPETVERLESALDRYAAVLERDTGATGLREMPGGGASGGLGAGLHALIGATLHPRYDIVMQYLDLDSHLRDADLVFTAEGGIDTQTPRGKIPAEVGHRAKAHGLPVIALAGRIGDRAQVVHEHGIDAFFSTVNTPETLEEAIARAPADLALCAEEVMRTVLVSLQIVRRRPGAADPADRAADAA
jgi:glycerate kinase